ncbi:ThuA domain-containing protein [Planctomonas psychrotolerans]|uniref:ThuA domain-containing protein n=1 Tax=Planctomonas psychrotolerans TaxID=2528712 RepID=UPI00123B9F3A|nr:ThuA domain-containing protein [Planctomonas psychrotolerans]
MTTALILSGGKGYTDPWHPFAATSARLESALGGWGYDVEVAYDVEERLTDLTGVDLLVVNTPGPSGTPDAALVERCRASLDGFVGRGGAILAMHLGITGFAHVPGWPELLGARWVQDRSGHPPIGAARVPVRPDAGITAISSVELYDELYTDLELSGDRTVLVDHELEERTHPLVWTKVSGDARIVVDLFGHGPESFDSASHLHLLHDCVRWAMQATPGAPLPA